MYTKNKTNLLWVAIETGFLHGIDGVPQKFMSILLAPKAKMSGNFCKRDKSMFSFECCGNIKSFLTASCVFSTTFSETGEFRGKQCLYLSNWIIIIVTVVSLIKRNKCLLYKC